MTIITINFSDFNLVEIKSTNDCAQTPHCKNHGAMNKMNALEEEVNLYLHYLMLRT